jgi:hypothetical protein
MAEDKKFREVFDEFPEAKKQQWWEYLDEEMSQVCEPEHLLVCHMYDFDDENPNLAAVEPGRSFGLDDHEKMTFYLGKEEADLVKEAVEAERPWKLVFLYGVRELGDEEGSVHHEFITSFQAAEDEW